MSNNGPGRPSPLNPHINVVEDWLRKGMSIAQIVEAFDDILNIKTQDQAVRGLLQRNFHLMALHNINRRRNKTEGIVQGQAEPSGVVKVNEDIIIITGEPGETIETLNTEDLLVKRGYDPADWVVQRVVDNQWEANAGRDADGTPTKITLYQYKVTLAKKVALEAIFPATEITIPFAAPKKPDVTKTILAVVTGDHQAPHQDPVLHELFLRWLSANQPDIGVIHGDLSDFGYISRHRDDPAYDSTVQECIQSSFGILYDYRGACEDTQWKLRKGNHDDRLRNELLERSERLYGVTAAQFPGDEPEEWVYSLNHLLHLKRLGIQYLEPKGTYEFEQVPLSDYIAVRHGHLVVKGGALKTAEQLGHSIVLGHTHRQSIARCTRWNTIKGTWDVLTAMEAGCMCIIPGGLGFANAGAPDWQPGFGTVTVFPDGQFTVDLATYEQSGTLRWRDQQYSV